MSISHVPKTLQIGSYREGNMRDRHSRLGRRTDSLVASFWDFEEAEGKIKQVRRAGTELEVFIGRLHSSLRGSRAQGSVREAMVDIELMLDKLDDVEVALGNAADQFDE